MLVVLSATCVVWLLTRLCDRYSEILDYHNVDQGNDPTAAGGLTENGAA